MRKIHVREGIENPITALRERHGLAPLEFALRLGLSPGYVSSCERGAVASPERLWQALERAGVDANGLVEAYDTYRRALQGPLGVA